MADENERAKDDKQPPWLALALALAAVTAPLTTAIHGWLSTSRELALNTAKQEHEIRLAYLDRAIDPNRTPADRQTVLRFLVAATASSDPVRAWAERELGEVNGDIDRLTKQRDELQESYKAVSARVKALQDELARVQGAGQGDSARVRALSTNLDSVREQARQAEAATNAINVALGKHEPANAPNVR
jgi:septal ring factor EnvC (AmiA/AmiB activator)